MPESPAECLARLERMLESRRARGTVSLADLESAINDVRKLAARIAELEAERPAVKARAVCAVCDRTDVTLTKGGAVRQHNGSEYVGRWRQVCAGSGQPPKDNTLELEESV